MKSKEIDPCTEFSRDIKVAMDKYYRQRLSENIKRGLARKKMFTCIVKNSKV